MIFENIVILSNPVSASYIRFFAVRELTVESSCNNNNIIIVNQVDVTDGKSLTFGKFHANVETAARHLLRLGCRHGDVIAIFSPNSFQWMMVAAAGLRIGAVFAAINHLLKPGIPRLFRPIILIGR